MDIKEFTSRDVPADKMAPFMFAVMLDSMRELLNLGEFKIKSISESEFRYFRKVAMDRFYEPLTAICEYMVEKGLLEKCDCGLTMRSGWKECENCKGLGYKDKK
ncbi:MAG: hypothetical protein AABY32_02595 [Nanoarchaeota archaeon]